MSCTKVRLKKCVFDVYNKIYIRLNKIFKNKEQHQETVLGTLSTFHSPRDPSHRISNQTLLTYIYCIPFDVDTKF